MSSAMATSLHFWLVLLLSVVLPSTVASRTGAAHFSKRSSSKGVSNESFIGVSNKHFVSGATCEDKFAKGLSCQIFVKFFGQLAFVLDMDESTTLGNLKERLEKWVRDKANGRGPGKSFEDQYNFLHRVNGHMKKLVGDDYETLLSLGITDAESEILAEGFLLGGVAYGTEVSIHGPSSFLWPDRDFIVQIYQADPERRQRSLCTGFINGRHVLTAAHCFYNKMDALKYITVIAGDGSEHKLESVSIIEGYRGGEGKLYASSPDLAVATINGDGYTPLVKVTLRTEPITKQTDVYLAGFGMTEKGGAPSRYRPLVEGAFMFGDDKCSVHTYTGYISPTLGCAHSPDSPTASCIGDSGAPWFLKEQDGTYSVFGVNMGADDCRGWANTRATADLTMLSETQSFWKEFF